MSVVADNGLLKKLFIWKKSLDINGAVFWIRIVNDQTVDDARRYGLLESRKLRKSLRDKESDDYLIYIDRMNDYTDEQLTEVVVNMSVRVASKEYMQRTPRPLLPKLDEFPSQEDLEEYEISKDLREKEYWDELESYLQIYRKELQESFSKRPRKQLEDQYTRLMVDTVCENKFSELFEDYVISAALFEDEECKKPMMDIPTFKQLPTEIKNQIKEEYRALTLTTEEIKN